MEYLKLSEIAYLLNGYAFKSAKYVKKGIRIIRIANVQDGCIVDEKPCYYPFDTDEDIKKFLLEENDLLVSLTGNVGRVGMITKDLLPAALNQRVCCIRIKDRNTVNIKYLFLFFRRKKYVQECIEASKGVAQLNLSTKWLENYLIPIPPLSVQERIVARIEELFSQLDAGVETLKKTKAQLAVYRQAVLKEAFEGRLTRQWRDTQPSTSLADYLDELYREKNAPGNTKEFQEGNIITLSELPKCWKWVHIGDITKGPEYGTSQKSLKEGAVPVLRMGNIQKGEIDWSDLAYSNDPDEIKKYYLEPNTILFNRTNSPEHVGKTAIYRGKREAIFAGYLIRINQLDCINPEYLNYYMNSYTAKVYGKRVKTDGVNQSNINGKKLCSYPFPLCTKEEQAQVVFELESRLSVCDSIERTVNEALQQAEAMRKSILRAAFEGK